MDNANALFQAKPNNIRLSVTTGLNSGHIKKDRPLPANAHASLRKALRPVFPKRIKRASFRHKAARAGNAGNTADAVIAANTVNTIEENPREKDSRRRSCRRRGVLGTGAPSEGAAQAPTEEQACAPVRGHSGRTAGQQRGAGSESRRVLPPALLNRLLSDNKRAPPADARQRTVDTG
jgi:hypothetical protein